MSLEKNIERIADALEAIARVTGGKIAADKTTSAPIQGDPQMPQQGNDQKPPQQMLQGGSQIPVSPPAGSGMAWTGAGMQPAAFPVQQSNPVQQGTTAPVQQQGSPVQHGMYPPQQAGSPVQQPGGSGIVPTTATAKQYTFDQLAVATANFASSGKDVFTILNRFGVGMLMDLPQERYGEYAAALREAGAVI